MVRQLQPQEVILAARSVPLHRPNHLPLAALKTPHGVHEAGHQEVQAQEEEAVDGDGALLEGGGGMQAD